MRAKLILIILIIPILGYGQIPAYYSGIDYGKNGDALKAELRTLISNTLTNPLAYTSSSSTDTWDAIKLSDLKDSSTTDVLLVYGYNDLDAITKNDRTRSKDSSCHTSGCNGLWNREHVFPQSLATPSMTTQFPGTGTDVHNLRAADGQENTYRGNDMYAAGSGNSQSLSTTTYYPGDEWRGDVARIIMYMYVKYDTECRAIDVGDGSTSYSPNGDMPNIFLEWNAQDPPTQYEMNRNNVFQNMQGNRNPFIDNPYLATKIWNGTIANNTWLNLSSNDIEKNHMEFYPTMTTGLVWVKNLDLAEVLIINPIGQKFNKKVQNNRIDISELANGSYIIVAKNIRQVIIKIN